MANQDKRLIDMTSSEIAALIRAEVDSCIKQNTPALSLEVTAETWINRKEALKTLGVSRPTLASWVVTGRVKEYACGSRVRYKRKDIENAFRERK
jgi:excisionase family DNA binding protein